MVYRFKFSGVYLNLIILANCSPSIIITTRRWRVVSVPFRTRKSWNRCSKLIWTGYATIIGTLKKSKKRYKCIQFETRCCQKELPRKSYASVVVIASSIIAILRRYPILYETYLSQYSTINLGHGVDWTENVLSRINGKIIPKSVGSVV